MGSGLPTHAVTESTVFPTSETWNIADGYTKLKILRLIIQLDIDEEIAILGRRDDDINFYDASEIPQRRVDAFDKFTFHLRQLIGNCSFAIRTNADKHLYSLYTERLNTVEEFSNAIAKTVTNNLTKETIIEINEEHFRKCFRILRNIKDELNSIINRAGLIFRQTEEMDLDKLMNEIAEGG